jgi:hypothetical protein
MSHQTADQGNHRGFKIIPKSINNTTSVPLECTSPWAGFELTTLVVMCTDCIGSKSNYHMIMTMTAPRP